MSFSSVTALGTAGVDTGGGNLVVTTAADAEVGRFVFVLIGKDNVATSDGTGSEITSVTDSAGNDYVSAGRFVNGQGASNAGAYVDIYVSHIKAQLSSGGTITIVKSTDVDCCATAYKVTIGAGKRVVVSATPGTSAEDNVDAASIATSSLANIEHLHIRAVASEYENANNLTVTDVTWTVLAGVLSSTAGLPAVNMRIDGEYKVSTSTGETSDPTMPSTTADRASILIAFHEVSKVPRFMHQYKQLAAAH